MHVYHIFIRSLGLSHCLAHKLLAVVLEHMSISFSHGGKFEITIAAFEGRHSLDILVHFEDMLLHVPFGAEQFAANVALEGTLLFMHALHMFFQAHFIGIFFSALRAHGLDWLVDISYMKLERQLVGEHFPAFFARFLLAITVVS